MIYTSYFANLKNLPPELETVSIARYSPNWYMGGRCTSHRETICLVPSAELLRGYKDGHVDESAYREAYFKQLDRHSEQVGNALKELDGMVFLCYEKPGDFCHRHLLAEYAKEFGYVLLEFRKDEQI